MSADLHFEAMPDRFPEMWDIVECIALQMADFPESEVETERGKVISSIRRNLDDSFVRPIATFSASLLWIASVWFA